MKTQDRTITIGQYVFDEKQHLHTLDGKPLTGTTTVLSVIAKPALIQWAANMACDYIQDSKEFELVEGKATISPLKLAELIKEARTTHKKKKESAGTHGTEVHSEVEKYIHDCLLNKNSGEAQSGLGYDERIQKFIRWSQDNKVKFLASEKHVYSRSMWVGGICDIVCEIDGKRYVGDIKTSSGIYPEHFIQASAYAAMLTEMGEYDKFDGVVIINLNKKGGFDVKFNYDLEGNLNCFKAALTLYRQLNAINPN